MEKKTLEISIPEGKRPKMTKGTDKCVIEWLDAKDDFISYVTLYRASIHRRFTVELSRDYLNWPKEFKYGLLQFIADDLNEEKIDWGSRSQRKYCVCYDHSNDTIVCDSWQDFGCVGYVFTGEAAKRAMKIIPAEFLKTF